ncbi:MAG: hypothetical protein WBA51_07780 [Erythrobacter sp.]
MSQNPPSLPARARSILAAFALIGVSACAGGSFTGPVEVTRFVAEQPANLGQGTIALRFTEDLKNEGAREAFRGALADQLSLLGYTVIDNAEIADQVATIETSRSALSAEQQRNPVSVGVGGGVGGGGFRGGLGGGLGVGINLGGGSQGPRVLSELRVTIAPADGGQNLWEGRAQFPTSVNSPYAPVDINARTLAAALFQDFPGGNGETVSIPAKDLVEPQ